MNCDSLLTMEIPEIQYLLSGIESKFGRVIQTTTHFEALSVDIERCIGEIVSASTLKRIWGYVNDRRVPRISTLDILSRYIGYKSFSHMCDVIKHDSKFNSSFFSKKTIVSSDLSEGDVVTIGWNPNRVVKFKYLGSSRYKVVESLNSKLEVGDMFEASNFILGYPFYIARILRNGEYTPSFVAGADVGITVLSKEVRV